MGLSAGMWGSVSGLLMHGEKMNVVGNNIANISTIGFKSQRMDFEDYIYQDSFSAGGITQIGRGVGISAVMGDFSQAAFETTNDPTDLAIGGKGFFQVKDPYSSQVWYTRAGNFRFDKEGVLRNPQGFALQGWEIDNREGPSIGTGASPINTTPSPLRGSGVPKDVRFNTWTVDPKQTSKMEMGLLLDTRGSDNSVDAKNPMFSLFGAWNGKQPPASPTTPPISNGAFSYSPTMQIFDEGGTAHTITTYFDKVSTHDDKLKNFPSGSQMFEYIVTMDPTEDMRTYGGKYDPITGILSDDMDNYTAPAAVNGSKLAAGQNWIGDGTGTMADALTFINNSLGKTAPDLLTAEDIGVKQYPSGGWTLDGNNEHVKAAMAQVGSGDPAVAAAAQAVVRMATPPAGPPADPKDANTVKKMSETKSAGTLMIGTLIFDQSGNLINQSAYTFKGGTTLPENDTCNFNPDDLNNWEPTPVSNNGLPVFTPNFSGQPLANSVNQKASSNSKNQRDAENYLVELDFGFKSFVLDTPWGAGGSAADVGTDYNKLAIMKDGQRSPTATSARSANDATQNSVQNGYTFGNLSSYNVDKEGVLYGMYSNGVQLPLFQIAMFDFVNTQGLRREGGNLFSSTMDSGNPRVGTAGQNGLGPVMSNSIEQSNVDMAREFVQMISTQRGFQANSKGITTIDAMLETVVGMKR